MDVYTLNSVLKRDQIIDNFISMIWTERVSSVGDFQLVVSNSKESRELLSSGTYLAIDGSKRVMECETIEIGEDDEGRSTLTVTGRSIEKILMERVAWGWNSGLDAEPKLYYDGFPADVAYSIFRIICVDGILSPQDIIPFWVFGNLFPADTIPYITEDVAFEFDPGTVYDAVKSICDQYKMGFRLYRGPDTSTLYFNVFMGSDRTTQQTTLEPVVFSPNLDNVTNISELHSIENYKNVAFVYSRIAQQYVYAENVDPSTAGFNRRVLIVDATSVEETDPVKHANLLKQKGLEELAKNRALTAFDGEIAQEDQYTYGVHYELGDLVDLQSTDGTSNQMRVTEQIFVSDENGERSYPTLSVDLLITAGSWLSRNPLENWVDAPGVWADQ